MTDRLKGVVVTFEEEMRADDAEQLIKAIGMMRNVLSVTPVIDKFEDAMNRERVFWEVRKALWQALDEIKKKF